jgi:hypothetical protein
VTAGSNLHALSKSLANLPAEMVREGTKQLQKPIEARAERDSGGDRRLSGLKRSGRFTVSTSVKGTTAVEGRVFAGPSKMRGAWSWLDRGTAARAQGKGRHPGTRGKGTWSEPVDAELPKVREAIIKRFTAAVTKG